MRRFFLAVSVLLLGFLPGLPIPAANADDEPKAEPPAVEPADEKSDKEMTEAEREAALKRAGVLNLRVVELWKARKYQEAEVLAREALGLREKILGPEHPEIAESLLNLGAQLDGQGRHGEARSLYERALRIREKALGPEHALVANCLLNLALLLQKQGQYEQARPLFERVILIHETTLGPDHLHVAMGLNNLARLLENTGQYEQARPLYERALRIREKALGPEHPDVAMSLSNLGGLLRETGQYEQARPLYDRALRICEKALGPDHPNVATILNNVAVLLFRLGAYEESKAFSERALRIRERALGPDHPHVATSLGNLAMLLQVTGRYEQARPLFERALEINEKTLGPTHALVGTSLNNLAGLLQVAGLYEQAQPLYERALTICEDALGSEQPDVAVILNNLALLLQTTRQYEQARPLHERALAIREKALGRDHPDVAVSLNNLASLLRATGQYEQACPLLERAVKIHEKAFGREHPDVAASLNNLALLLQTMGHYERARPLHERALKIREKAYGREHLSVATSLNNLAELYRATEQYERAAPLLARCLDICQKHVRRNLVGLQASERRALVRSLRLYLDNWFRLAPHLARSGYDEVLRLKGVVARATVAERMLARAGGEDAAVRVTAFRAAEHRLAQVANARPSFRDKAKLAAWQKAYAKATTQREEVALTLSQDFAPLRTGLERLDIHLSDIQAQLGTAEVLVDYLRSGDAYFAWIVRPEGEAERIDLGKADAIEAAAAALAAQAADPEADDAALITAGKVRRDSIFAPIERRLGEDIHTLYICPDAALAAVPFAGLPSKTEGHLLIDDYRITMVSMAQDLVPWKDEPELGRGSILLGGVDYGYASEGAEEATGTSSRPIASVDRAPRGGNYTPLPGSQQEVKALESSLGVGAIVLLGADATEYQFRASAKGKRVLHLATHGFVRDDLMRGLARSQEAGEWLGADMERQLAAGYDPMLLAGLALAGANPREGGHGDDGVLTALEASHLDLDGVELVVLSACQTALGKAESGEGVIGLVQGFQMAGAKQVIGSLWKVDDDATRALMVKFYELWSPKTGKGLRVAAALRKAQEHVRSQEKWKHPYYWAAWVAYGR